MRDPKRISDVCFRLANVWKKVPDWRLGQLLTNIFGRTDLFYMEDDQLIQAIEDFFNKSDYNYNIEKDNR